MEIDIKNNDEKKTVIAISALKFVDDPEVGLNVADLGLIYELNFDENENRIVCTQTLTTEFCPMGESIIGNVKMALEEAFPDTMVDVFLTFDPPWSFEKISDDGREFLGM